MFNPQEAPLVARTLLDLLHAAELAQRGVASIVSAHATFLILRRLQFQVRAHFLGHIGIEFFSTEERAKAGGDEAAEVHRSGLATLKITKKIEETAALAYTNRP